MSQVFRKPNFFTGRINCYCPAMKYDADHVMTGAVKLNIGNPIVAAAGTLLNAVDMTAGKTKAALTAGVYTADANFGRVLKIVFSTTSTAVVTIYGRDFWGQPMLEALTGNAGTIVNGKKAFMYVDAYSCDAVAANLSIGILNIFGLPYKTTKVLEEIVDDAPGTVGTLTAAVLTDPATSTTGDPRGTYTPNTTPDGTKVIELTVLTDSKVNAAFNGGLMGIRHYYA